MTEAAATRILHRFPGGLRLDTHMHWTAGEQSLLQPIPGRMVLPLQQHIGLPAVPLVKAGDRVLKGQKIAESGGYVSVALHASTSGVIRDIGEYPVVQGRARCIVIEPDGEDRWFPIEPFHDYASEDPGELQRRIRECGIAGLGGAGFPSHVKIMEGVENAVDTLIINGVECEPYITCDDRLIQEKAGYIVAGTRMIGHAVQARHRVIAVESDMADARAALEPLVGDDIELVTVPARYPAGGEKQLVQVITGKEVPSGGLAIHVGVVVQNVATAAAVYRAVTRGEPVVSRYVTVAGEVLRPRNLQVLLGTPLRDCLRTCGYDERDGMRVIVGGPMMGRQVTDLDVPVTKTTNCILVQREAPASPELPCIRCGACVDVCPVRLLPQQLYRSARAGDLDAVQQLHLFDCIECGCCAYVCPSHIPLVRYYRHAKAEIAAEERRREGADRARARFLARRERLAGEEDDGAPAETAAGDDRRAYIEAAVARTRARRRDAGGEGPDGSADD